MFVTSVGPSLPLPRYFGSTSVTNYFRHNLVNNFRIEKRWASRIVLSINNRRAMPLLSPSFTSESKMVVANPRFSTAPEFSRPLNNNFSLCPVLRYRSYSCIKGQGSKYRCCNCSAIGRRSGPGSAVRFGDRVRRLGGKSATFRNFDFTQQ